MMEDEVVSAGSPQKQEFEDLSMVVQGASSKLGSLQLSSNELIITLLRLLTRSKEITTAILKESTDSCIYDDGYKKLLHISASLNNIKLAMRRLLELCTKRQSNEVRDMSMAICNIRLYVALNNIELFLAEKHATYGDQKPLRAGQVLALIVNTIDILQTCILENSLADKRKTSNPSHAAFETKTIEILEVINIAVNRLEAKNSLHLDTTVVKNVVTILNLINRLVAHPGFKNLRNSEKEFIRSLVHRKLSTLQAGLQHILRAPACDNDKKLLCKIASASLSRYAILVNNTLKNHPRHQLQTENSLAFTLTRCLATSFEIHELLLNREKFPFPEEKKYTQIHTVKKICNAVYLSITAYLKQLVLISHSRTPDSTYYSTSLSYIEDALQKTGTLKSDIDADNAVMCKHLCLLEKSLEESVELCTRTLQKRKTCTANVLNTLSRIDELVVMDSFYSSHRERPSELLESVDEEMWLQGRGRM